MDITRLLADGLLMVILLIAAGFGVRGFRWRKWRIYLPVAIMAGLTSLLAGKLMSLVYQPSVTRPFIEKGVEAGAAYIDNPGFPSDHALLACVAVIALFFLTPYRRIAMLLGALALIMSIARVSALVHTPLDILGGVIAAGIGALWYRAARLRQS